jgi:hypothetical protein
VPRLFPEELASAGVFLIDIPLSGAPIRRVGYPSVRIAFITGALDAEHITVIVCGLKVCISQ